ncbi:GIY-YIG nuclease family protein [Candidatus Gottesmanbacteria bacterium]|nr:GIY-YIG nuclease family protein [Candidatus Gottesmanbacteria bacterium]
MYTTYVIQSESSGRIYIGESIDWRKRLERHNSPLKSKKGSYTRLNKGPWKLIYKENFTTRKEALRREKELKSYRGRDFIKQMMGR